MALINLGSRPIPRTKPLICLVKNKLTGKRWWRALKPINCPEDLYVYALHFVRNLNQKRRGGGLTP